MGKRLDRVSDYVDRLIAARLDWTRSPEGRKQLGPGSPTVPGLQDLYAVRDAIDVAKRK
jgi:hypothetical protein